MEAVNDDLIELSARAARSARFLLMRTIITMKQSQVIVYVGIGAISLLLGIILGWKLHETRLTYLKKQREFHIRKAEQYQHELNH